jgi:adenylate cyclase
LCVPIPNRNGEVFAVAHLLNKRSGAPFDDRDEQRFRAFAASISPVLESWVRMNATAVRRAEASRADE